MALKPKSRELELIALDKKIISCKKCPRLVDWKREVAITKRKSYENETYWAKPVPGFGATDPELVIVGLAPGAHGANRTGRIFTGDSSGDWLFRALHRAGLAKIATSRSSDDGQELYKTRILCAVRCAPPDNKPTFEERDCCAPFMAKEIEILLPTVKTFLVLGNFGWNALLTQLTNMNFAIPKPKPKFGHGVEFKAIASNGTIVRVVGSYHPSQQNTFTGKLTEEMLDSVIKLAMSTR